MIDTIIILMITASAPSKVLDYTVYDVALNKLNHDEAILYRLKDEVAVVVKEETEIYLTSIVYRISAYQKQIKLNNAVPETVQHNYKRDFKSLE